MKTGILATDLDGTLIGGTGDFSLYDNFRSRLEAMQAADGTVWVVCTGRSLRSFQHLFSPMKIMGFMPDYVIVNHAYIYRRTKSGRYRPHHSWNLMIRYHIWSSRLHIKDALSSWYDMVTDTVDNVTTVYHRHNRLCMRFDTEADAEAVAKILKKKSRWFRYLKVFQFSQEVDVRMVPFTKGMSLQELSGRLGVTGSEVLAIGNGHNDISMLDRSFAEMTGCPANAETDVIAVVSKSGGHISEHKGLAGVIDVIDAYKKGRVNSRLPDWWKSTRLQKNPKSASRYMNHPPKPKRQKSINIVVVMIVIMVLYSVLLAFANYGVIPGSAYICKPLILVVDWVSKTLDWLGL